VQPVFFSLPFQHEALSDGKQEKEAPFEEHPQKKHYFPPSVLSYTYRRVKGPSLELWHGAAPDNSRKHPAFRVRDPG
jgi:hypothetical protein